MSVSSSQHQVASRKQWQKADKSSIQRQSQARSPGLWPLEKFWQEESDQKQRQTEKGMQTEKESLTKRKETEKESQIQKGDPGAEQKQRQMEKGMRMEKESLKEKEGTETESEIQGDPGTFIPIRPKQDRLSAPGTQHGELRLLEQQKDNQILFWQMNANIKASAGAASLIEKEREKETHRQDPPEVEEEPRMEWFTQSAWVEFALLADRNADSAWVMIPMNLRPLWREQRLALLRDTWDSSHHSGNSRCNDHGDFETLLHTEAWQETQTFSQQYYAFIRKPLSERTRQLTQASGKPEREGGQMADS